MNKNTNKPYKEKDLLGGHDIYSSSKAAAEILFQSYHDSFFIQQAKNLKKVTLPFKIMIAQYGLKL